jgi:SPP1 gp7 family putative phage head morphogenesis protein
MEKRSNVTLATGDGFKSILKSVEKAFKKLHANGGYKPEDLAKTKEYKNLIKETSQIFESAITDNDVPEQMSKSLKEDVFIFSGLKTHAQLFEASRLLLTEDNKVKSFSQFSKDVQSIKENYNQNYLEAEYQFAISSAQSAANWANISTDYDLQYRTANDNHVRASHAILHDTTLPADDAFWIYYYPPNGWRCRCLAIQVRKGKYDNSNSKVAIANGDKATSQIGKDGKNKLAIFRYNPGMSKIIFPPEHPYTKVKGAETVRKELSKKTLDRYKDTSFDSQKGINNTGVLEIFTTGKQNPQEYNKNKKALTVLANNGGHYRMLPVIEDGNKNPDALNLKTTQLVDIKVAETTNGKNIVQSALKEASKQGVSEVVIHLTKKPDSYRTMYGAVLNTFKQDRAKNIKTITVIYPGNFVKSYEVSRFKKKKA